MYFKNTTKQMWFDLFKDGAPVKYNFDKKLVVKFSPTDKIFYYKIKVPFMSERDSLLRFQWINMNDLDSLMLIQSIQLNEIPINPEVVRIEYFYCFLVRQDTVNSSDLKVSSLFEMDFKGMLPLKISNVLMTTVLYDSNNEIEAMLRGLKHTE